MGEAAQTPVVVWRSQPGPQTALLSCPVYEAFFGGARGGGKTDGVLGDWAAHANRYARDAIGIMVRRTRIELTETFERAKVLYEPLGALLTGGQNQPMRCVMPNGARLRFDYLERDSDADNYQGHSYTRVYVEEAGNFPSPSPIKKLHATLRSGAGVPCRMRLTGNPGGPGHQWVKARYIDPAPRGFEVITDPETGLQRVYIPSRVSDNAYLGDQYVAQLRQTGSPELVRAWLEGDWSVISGAFFPEWSTEKHVVAPRRLPDNWLRFGMGDWGSAKPFAWLWAAVSDGSMPEFPRGALVVYREWYGSTGEPNVGLRMVAEDVGRGIAERQKDDPLYEGRPILHVADPAMFTADGGPSIAERMALAGKISIRRADNARVSQRGAMGGWDQVRARLQGEEDRPMLYVFSTCTHLIRTLPALQHDPDRPEDVDTDGEDHACFAAGTVIDGLGRVESVGHLTRCATDVVRVVMDDDRSVVCTPDHQFLTEDGSWQRADQLQGRRLWCQTPSKSLKAFGITGAAAIFSARVCDFIAWCMSGTMALSRRAATSTMWTTIRATTHLITSRFSLRSIIWPTTAREATSPPPPAPPLASGTNQPMVEGGTKSTGAGRLERLLQRALQKLATIAGNLSRQAVSRQIAHGSAIPTARPVRCVAVEPMSERLDVYCLPTKGGWLQVAGGIVASNCDALRYGCMSRPYVRKVPENEPGRLLAVGSLNQVRLDDLWPKAGQGRRRI